MFSSSSTSASLVIALSFSASRKLDGASVRLAKGSITARSIAKALHWWSFNKINGVRLAFARIAALSRFIAAESAASVKDGPEGCTSLTERNGSSPFAYIFTCHPGESRDPETVVATGILGPGFRRDDRRGENIWLRDSGWVSGRVSLSASVRPRR